MAYAEAVAARIRKALTGRTGIVEKKMFGGVAFLQRGKMLIGVMGQGALVRVPEADHEKTVKPPHVKPMRMGGRTMRGWLQVTGPTIASPAGLQKWIATGEKALAAKGKKP